jgi:hypothetical protein
VFSKQFQDRSSPAASKSHDDLCSSSSLKQSPRNSGRPSYRFWSYCDDSCLATAPVINERFLQRTSERESGARRGPEQRLATIVISLGKLRQRSSPNISTIFHLGPSTVIVSPRHLHKLAARGRTLTLKIDHHQPKPPCSDCQTPADNPDSMSLGSTLDAAVRASRSRSRRQDQSVPKCLQQTSSGSYPYSTVAMYLY